MDTTLVGLEQTQKKLITKLKEYDCVEKFFGVDESGDIIYNKQKDHDFAVNNVDDCKDFMGYESFIDWVGKKVNKN
jgi:hypothetical protein